MPSYALNATKTLTNYGIKIYGSTYDPVFGQGVLFTKPNLSIIGSSCFIDYSGTENLSDLNYLKKVFASTPAGTTFQFSNSSYYDPDFDYTVDPTGVFSLQTLTGNNRLIIGNVVSGFTYTTNYRFYNKSNFVNPPQFTTGYTGGSTAANYIQNNLATNPGKSFINFGIVGSNFGKEEYIEITGSTSNKGKIKANSPIKLKDNRELIYTDTTLTNEDLSTSGITMTHYLRGDSNPEILSKSRKNLGCYVVFDSNGNQIQCFENQNQLQAFLRSQFESTTYTTQWIPTLYCSRLTDNGFNAASADKTLLYDSSIFVIVEEVASGTFGGDGNFTFNYIYLLKTNAEGNDNIQTTSEVTFTIDNGFKIDLSHPTLKGFSVNAYLDEYKTILMNSDYYLIGIPGFDQSGIFYTKTSTSARKIYLEFTGPANLSLVVNVN
jgi:hypothetical protein